MHSFIKPAKSYYLEGVVEPDDLVLPFQDDGRADPQIQNQSNWEDRHLLGFSDVLKNPNVVGVIVVGKVEDRT